MTARLQLGAWGPALFSDDTACDVRDTYRDLVGDGLSGPAATLELERAWAQELLDPDDGPVFWLALAVTQWRSGRLEPRVKDKALEVIGGGVDLERWNHDAALRLKRARNLQKLADQLSSPQPPEKRIPRRFRDSCDWEPGEHIAYELRSGSTLVLRVIGHHSGRGGVAPVCEFIDWHENGLPNADDLREARILEASPRPSQFMIGRTSKRELPTDRLTRLGFRLPPSQDLGELTVLLWRFLDQYLEEHFGLN